MRNVFFIVGPTASGKSELAAAVAERCGAEVVSADAFQIYRGLPLLTAQPDEATRRLAPHHLIEALPLSEEMSAEKFREMALSAIAEIHQRGKPALVVGGSGLYLKALTHGLAPLPPVDLGLRAQLDRLSREELSERLVAVDPLGAKKIDPKNKRRVVRALEIFAQTNAPASAQRSQWQAEVAPAPGVFIFRDRPELNDRIDRRVQEMFRAGVVEEVAAIEQPSITAATTLGLREIQRLISGEITEAACLAAIRQATRRYAKRQLTWFRRQTNFDPLNLSLFKDHEAALGWLLQRAASSFSPAE